MNYVKVENGTIVEGPLPYKPSDTWLEYVVKQLPYKENIPKKVEVTLTLTQYIVEEVYCPAYSDLRRSEYPPITEQLDALWKGGEALEQMRQQVMAVKEKYPKE